MVGLGVVGEREVGGGGAAGLGVGGEREGGMVGAAGGQPSHHKELTKNKSMEGEEK